MKFVVANPQIRDVTFKYTDSMRADIDIEEGPFDTREEAEEWNEREFQGECNIIAFADEYMDQYPEVTTSDSHELNPDVNYVEATFYPQIQKDDYYHPAPDTDPIAFLVPEEDTLDEDGNPIGGDTFESDSLKDCNSAPAAVKNWEGPFYITLKYGISPDDYEDYPKTKSY